MKPTKSNPTLPSRGVNVWVTLVLLGLSSNPINSCIHHACVEPHLDDMPESRIGVELGEQCFLVEVVETACYVGIEYILGFVSDGV